ALLAWRRGGWRRAFTSTLLAAAVGAAMIWCVGADPLRTFLQEKERDHTVFERLGYYLSPRTALGLGAAAFGCAVVGAAAVVRRRLQSPHLVACLLLFVVYSLAVVSMGVITRRFMAPAVPLGCVLAAAGVAQLGAR